ncbi:MAG: type II toxin-antitoxin system PemK/MazF family toxin [Candidatus Latescibacteria bacterium]|nr:mRNA interferase MazF2 [Gemmatimonadaceae bacterium]MDP6015623.1 type II toxin-antitoxin system PemK/MazF family toxin [Candidatus Latescibacterota bacterium]MDP7447795.1 type II toxin-antitoxin system PemK/MazF family toxin [Candidatus Latescibacterota bacterium]HJP29223.1 type II toxin-antitoxin system PemK/MazF family toxin [Candidatus Latescibacterota bacterium]
MKRGEIWWADLEEPRGSEPGFRRPVLVVQSDAFNRSHISSVVVAALTSNVGLGAAPGNVPLSKRISKLSRDSVVNVSQLLTLDRRFLTERVSRLSKETLSKVEAGLRLVLSL